MLTLRSRWPSERVQPRDVFVAIGGTAVTDALCCPRCGASLSVYYSELENAAWCSCSACDWCGDHIELFAAMTGAPILDALAALRLRGIPVPATCTHYKTLRSYTRHIDARSDAAAFAVAMRARKVARQDAPIFAAYNLTAHAHHSPHWWCAHSSEIEAAFGQRLGHSASVDQLCLAIPHYDEIGRVVGTSVGRIDYGVPVWEYLSVYGATPGVGLLWIAPIGLPISVAQIITDSPDVAMRYQSAQSQASLSMFPILLLNPNALVASASALPRPPSRTEAHRVFVSQHPPRSMRPEAFDLARRLGARIVQYAERQLTKWPHELLAAASAAQPWTTVLRDAVTARTGWGVTSLVAALDWDEALDAELAAVWSKTEMNEVRAATTRLHLPPRIPLARDLTIEVTPRGWHWLERNLVVAAYPPVLTRAYVSTSGTSRLRYEGYVFDSEANHRCRFDVSAAKFRRDPFAVVDSAMLRANLLQWRKTTPHPIIVPHAAALARYLLSKRPVE